MRDLLIEIWSSVKKNRLRTVLTGFAVAWGIFMLIVLLGAGNGLLNAIKSNASNFIANSMMAGGGTTSIPYNGLKEGRRIWLDSKDIETTAGKQFHNNIDEITAQRYLSGLNISRNDQYLAAQLLGVYPAYKDIEKVEMLYGRFINKIDLDERRKVMILGYNQAIELMGGKGNPASLIGERMNVGSMSFLVIGIYRTDESSMYNNIYCPFSTIQMLSASEDRFNNIIFSFHGLKTEKENEAFEAKYRAAINKNHLAAPEDHNAVWIWNRFTNNMEMEKGTKIIFIALWIIGIFTLLSGIVGVSNIMLITVKERTHEFGIRKALGATPSSILRLIIIESIAITAFFGYIGMILGLCACELMDATIGQQVVDLTVTQIKMFSNPTVGVSVAVKATILLIVAGTLAGYIPAKKASGILPIEALRAE